jgi:hypothetical protein
MSTSSSSLAVFLALTPFDALHQCLCCIILNENQSDRVRQIYYEKTHLNGFCDFQYFVFAFIAHKSFSYFFYFYDIFPFKYLI